MNPEDKILVTGVVTASGRFKLEPPVNFTVEELQKGLDPKEVRKRTKLVPARKLG